jgi:hypothetical protein
MDEEGRGTRRDRREKGFYLTSFKRAEFPKVSLRRTRGILDPNENMLGEEKPRDKPYDSVQAQQMNGQEEKASTKRRINERNNKYN